MSSPPIGPYLHPPPLAACYPYDPRAPRVFRRTADLIRARLPAGLADMRIEHIGSTAVPGCAGKDNIDLLIVYRHEAELAAVKQALAALGFQPQRTRDPFPEDRPMRTGTLTHDGDTFLLHVHVVLSDSPEVAALLGFRDRPCADPALLADYVAQKRAIIAADTTDSIDYSRAKGEFIGAALMVTGETAER